MSVGSLKQAPINPAQVDQAQSESTGAVDKLARRLLFDRLDQLSVGRLVIHEGDEVYAFGAEGSDLIAHIHVEHPSLYREVVFNGSVGAGEAYMRGTWRSPDLVKVIQIFSVNMDVLQAMDSKRSLVNKMLLKLFHLFNRNSAQGSRKNIAAHYDLGNDFFALFLDPTMMYSAAVFERANTDLDAAAVDKLDGICRKLQLKPTDHLLEIGTGWGGMAIYAAEHYGCKVTTTTISREQYEYACAQVKARELEDRITLLLEDYRDLTGQYDKLVSIEMIEAVGFEYYQTYFKQCAQLLKPDGLLVIQAITMVDQRYEAAKREVDFIKRYIFPGGSLPSIAVIADQVKCHTDMQLVQLDDITLDYAKTLACWRERFMNQLDAVREQGFDEAFIRMWEFYLCYCEGGFRERVIGTVQVTMAKPGFRSNKQESI